jgi:aspartate aminotransferase-like enzyme
VRRHGRNTAGRNVEVFSDAGVIEAGRFFLPGPTEVRPEILQTLSQPMIGHRGAGMQELMHRVTARLGPLFGTKRPVHVITGSGTSALELAIRGGTQRRVLSVVHGDFGERFARMVEACGRSVERLKCEPGQVVELDRIRDALRNGAYDAVLLTHSETGTGALADVAGVAAIMRQHEGCLLLVDGVSSVGAVSCRLDDWGVDALVTASQKAFALPPGLGFAAVSERLVERARKTPDRGIYLDVLKFEDATPKGQSPTTPAISLLFALDRQLADIEAETVAGRVARHTAMANTCWDWAERVGHELGVEIIVDRAHRSPSVSCFRSRETPATILKRVRERGYQMGGGQPPLKDSTFRIGHMGDHTVRGVTGLLEVLEQVLRSG